MGRSGRSGETQDYAGYGNGGMDTAGRGAGYNASYGTGRGTGRPDPYARPAGSQGNPYAQQAYPQGGPYASPYAQQAGPHGSPYAQQPSPYARGAAGVSPVSAGYGTGHGRSASSRRRNPVPAIIAVVLVLAVLAVGAWFVMGALSTVTVTVNGQQVELKKGDALQTLVDKGYATPQPGNLLAVDGSVFTPGGGTPYTATVNDAPAEGTYALQGGEQVTIGDGTDVTEDATVTEEPIAHGWSDDSKDFSSYWAGSLHILGDGRDGVRTVRTGTLSGITQTEDTVAPVDGGYRVFTAQVDRPVVALTFDDGPWPETTAAILDILEQNRAKATFFTIGNQIPGNEALMQRARDLGCEVCTHSWDHAAGSGQGVNLTYMSAEEQVNEVLQGYAAIADALGEEPPHVMRAPGGNFNGELIDNLWPYVDAEVGWDVDTEDWSRPGTDAIVQSILSVQPGQVVLMHDGGGDRWQTVEALRQALPILVEQGYEFVTVSELIEMAQG